MGWILELKAGCVSKEREVDVREVTSLQMLRGVGGKDRVPNPQELLVPGGENETFLRASGLGSWAVKA